MSYTLDVYDVDGVTHLSTFATSRSVAWQDELSFPGSMTFEVPLDDPAVADISDRRFVKVSEGGSVRFACRITSEKCQLAVDGRKWLRFENQPGAQCVLDDAVLEPEYGLNSASGPDRLFGPMSAEGTWYDSSDWAAPVGVDYTADVSINPKRKHQDPILSRLNPQWIAPDPGPAVAADPGTVAWFRSSITIGTGDGGDYAVMIAGDDYTTVYCDGQTVFQSDRTVLYAWRTVQTETVTLSEGHHLFAASVENRNSASSGNVIGFVFVLIKLNNTGDPTGTPILMSNETDWICTINEVGWHRGQLLLRCISEASDRPVESVERLTLSFGADTDSNGDAWADTRQQWSVPVATATISDVVAMLTESDMDVWLNPSTMVLNAYNRKGSDLSGTVALQLGEDGGTLKSFETTKTVARHTVGYYQLADGRWVSASDSSGLASYGRIEVGLQIGTVTDRASGSAQAARELEKSAHPVVTSVAQPSSLAGPVAGVDYHLGDTITVPSSRGTSTSKQRVLGIAHDRSGDVPQDYPEFVPDGSL